MKVKLTLTLLSIFLRIVVFSQNHVTWKFSYDKTQHQVIAVGKIDPTWHIYSKKTDPNSGPVATILTVNKIQGVKPIGVFHMADEKGPDEKIICVPISDPIWNNKNDISDLNPHRLKEIEHFFQVYKDLEKKKVDVGGWGNATEAMQIYKDCVRRYEKSDYKKTDNFKI